MKKKKGLFEGELKRGKYIFYMTLFFLIGSTLSYFDEKVGQYLEIWTGVLIVILGIIALSFTIRRLHDAGMSGWFALLLLFPPIGFLLILFLFFKSSK